MTRIQLGDLTAYRGYLFYHNLVAGLVFIYYGSDYVDTTYSVEEAEQVVDIWMEAV